MAVAAELEIHIDIKPATNVRPKCKLNTKQIKQYSDEMSSLDRLTLLTDADCSQYTE